MGVAAHAVHRQDPGPPLLHLLHDDNPSVRARAFEAAAELGRVDLRPMALHARSDKDPYSRFCAAWAAARLGDRSAETLGILRETAVTPGPHQERALALAIRCLPPPEAVEWIRQLWKDPSRLRLAALGAGAAGDPALAGVLIEWMGIEAVARVAGEAFSTITGADLAYLDLDQDPPERPHGEDADEFEVLDADERPAVPGAGEGRRVVAGQPGPLRARAPLPVRVRDRAGQPPQGPGPGQAAAAGRGGPGARPAPAFGTAVRGPCPGSTPGEEAPGMDFVNKTELKAGWTMGFDRDGRELVIVAIKATYTIPAREDEEPELAEEQVPLTEADVFAGEPGLVGAGVRVGLRPPQAEVRRAAQRHRVLRRGEAGGADHGRAAGRPHGPSRSTWSAHGSGRPGCSIIAASRPEPFTQMPISYANAFGGVDRAKEDPATFHWYPYNHAGVGYHEYTDPKSLDGRPLPNTEETGKKISDPSGKYRPMAFGPVGRSLAAPGQARRHLRPESGSTSRPRSGPTTSTTATSRPPRTTSRSPTRPAARRWC